MSVNNTFLLYKYKYTNKYISQESTGHFCDVESNDQKTQHENGHNRHENSISLTWCLRM